LGKGSGNTAFLEDADGRAAILDEFPRGRFFMKMVSVTYNEAVDDEVMEIVNGWRSPNPKDFTHEAPRE
jgi:hypothetical protein